MTSLSPFARFGNAKAFAALLITFVMLVSPVAPAAAAPLSAGGGQLNPPPLRMQPRRPISATARGPSRRLGCSPLPPS